MITNNKGLLAKLYFLCLLLLLLHSLWIRRWAKVAHFSLEFSVGNKEERKLWRRDVCNEEVTTCGRLIVLSSIRECVVNLTYCLWVLQSNFFHWSNKYISHKRFSHKKTFTFLNIYLHLIVFQMLLVVSLYTLRILELNLLLVWRHNIFYLNIISCKYKNSDSIVIGLEG